jgi:hypothetical protein
LGIFIGLAMLIKWLITGWVAGPFGWRAAFQSCLTMAVVLAGIAFTAPTNWPLGMALMSLGGFTPTRAPTTALGIDLAGRRIFGTASGLLPWCIHLNHGLQALVMGWILNGTGGSWMLVFLLLAALRVLSSGVMGLVKA